MSDRLPEKMSDKLSAYIWGKNKVARGEKSWEEVARGEKWKELGEVERD